MKGVFKAWLIRPGVQDSLGVVLAAGPSNAGELAERLGVGAPALSFHLNIAQNRAT